MKIDATSRIAAITLAVMFLSNDLVASANVLFRGIPQRVERHDVRIPTPVSDAYEAHPASVATSMDAHDAYLGSHENDRSDESQDNVFSVDLNYEPGEYAYAFLQYEVYGIDDPNSIPKSVNGGQTYGEQELESGSEWKEGKVRISVDDLRRGVNHILFSKPEQFHFPVQVRNVNIVLSDENEESRATQPVITRIVASTTDFEVLDEDVDLVGYSVTEAEMASIPGHIRNVTRRAPAYHLDGRSSEGYHIAIGVDASLVTTPTQLDEVEIFFFDRTDGLWKRAHRVKADREQLRIEAMVPGETDYFAGMIQAPEMPEANAYVPTNITDLEPVNPATGMRLMQAPQVNRTGSASISYPLWIPSGRNGMTPPLSVNYNSDGGTGWMGVGWNISASSISVDTKWGVPQYSGSFETEGYIVDGTPVYQEGGFRPNIAVLDGSGQVVTQPRVPSSSLFFPKVQNSYQQIERVGSSPSDYVWKVTDASQTVRYYGTTDGVKVNGTSVLRRGTSGPIAQWMLTKEVDQWGNTIEYEYAQTSNSSSGSVKNGGKGIYLSKIKYTGFQGTPGKYEIHFIRDSKERRDGSVNMNYGFKVIDDQRLNEVRVYYGTQFLASYKFGYTNESFTHFKTVLDYIAEFRGTSPATATEFYRHTMKYYDEGDIEYEASPDNLDVDHENNHLSEAPWYVRTLLNPLYSSLKPSPMNTSLTEGSSGHGGIGIGLSGTFLGVTFDKTSSINIGLNGSKSTTDVVRQMMDMNGDGMQDMLMDEGSRVYYRPIRRDNNGQLSIGSRRLVNIDGFSRSESSSIGGKVEVVGPKASGPLQVGINYSRSRSETLRSLTDYNADGFPDLLYRSGNSAKVLFGSVDDRGDYSFAGSSENTHNPVLRGVSVAPPPSDDDFKKPMEVVRVWEAFEAGEVRITGTASMIDGQDGPVDVAIQHNMDFVTGGFQTVTPSVSQNFNEVIPVEPGDVILFRSRCGDDGQEDILQWNPQVEYLSGDKPDGQGATWGVSTADDAFLLSTYNGVSFSVDRGFRVVLNYSNETQLSDDVKMFIDLYLNGELQDTYAHTLEANSMGSVNNTFAPFIAGNPGIGAGYYNVEPEGEDDIVSIKFRLESSSNVQWNDLLWLPNVELEPDCTDPVETIYAIPEYLTFNKLKKYADVMMLEGVDSDGEYQLLPVIGEDEEHISTIFSASGQNETDVVYMTLKNESRLAEKIAIEFYSNRSNPSLNTITFRNVDMDEGLDYLDPSFIGTTTLDKSSYTYAPGATFNMEEIQEYGKVEFFAKGPFAEAMIDYIIERLEGFDLYHEDNGHVNSFGPEDASFFFREHNELEMHYKHWGLCSWSADEGMEDEPINPEELHFPLSELAGQNPDEYDLGEIQNNPGGYNAEEFNFWHMQAVRGENARDFWRNQEDKITGTRNRDRYTLQGHHIGIFRKTGYMTPMIQGEIDLTGSDISIAPGTFNPSYTAGGTLTQSRSHTLSINGGASQISGAVNISDPVLFYSRSKSLFADMNGDGYPDILVDDDGIKGQFTNPLGGHTGQVGVSHIDRLNKGTSIGARAAWSGSYGNEDQRFATTGFSASMTFSKTRTQTFDINGDGLPDAYSDGINSDDFRLGTGSGFEASTFVPKGTIQNQGLCADASASAIGSFLGSFSSYVKSISAGLNINMVGNFTDQFYFDINGDGLQDYIDLTGSDDLYLNTGTGFVKYTLIGSLAPSQVSASINESGATGISAQLTLTLGPIISFLKLPISGGYGDNFSINRVKTSFIDMNGDGAPDYIHSDNGNLKIYYAKFGKLNKLKSVTNPLGGSFTIDYDVVGNKRGYFDPVIPTHMTEISNEKMLWDMPTSKWVMSSLVIDDGLDVVYGGNDIDGVDETIRTFAYDGGIKLRREREFAGFTRIATIYPDHLNELEDYCTSSTDFEVDNPRSTAGWYTAPECTNTSMTLVKPLARYNMQVKDYVAPEGLTPDDMKLYAYKKDIMLHGMTLHVHEWRDSAYVGTFYPGQSSECDADHWEKWTHQHVELLSDKEIEYELRIVETGTEKEPMAGIGQIIEEKEDDWLLLEDRYPSLGRLVEYATVFPATTDKRDLNFPVVEDRDGVNIQKYHIEYDEYFNVVWFEDFGTLISPDLDTIPVDTIYTGHYEYLTQNNPCTVLGTADAQLVPVDNIHYYVHVVCQDSTYEPDTIYGVYPSSSSCGDFPGVGPAETCTDEGGSFESNHRKWVIEETVIYKIIDASTYDHRLIAVMEYFDPVDANQRTNALEDHKVYTQNVTSGNLRRHTKVMSLNGGDQAPQQIGNYLTASDVALTDLTYDGYGNVTQIEAPMVPGQSRPTSSFVYDTDVHQFVERVNNPYGEFHCNLYDYGYQLLEQTTDINGQVMRYAFDGFQRPKHIWAPREVVDPTFGPTISYDYYPGATVPYAVTSHNTSNANTTVNYGAASSACGTLTSVSGWTTSMTSSVQTATYTDGIDRVVQVQTLADWDDPSTPDHMMTPVRRISGLTEYNEFGLNVVQYNDSRNTSSTTFAFDSAPSTDIEWVKYDYLNRPVEIHSRYPDSPTSTAWSMTKIERLWDSYGSHLRYYETTRLDGKAGKSVCMDHKGRQLSEEQFGIAWTATSETTEFEYDAFGQLIRVEDPASEVTRYTYDWFGRMIEEIHPDRDSTFHTYDLSGNLMSTSTSGSRENGANEEISYSYNLNRVIGKTLPSMSDYAELYNVAYTYGTRGDGNNGAGRVVSVVQGNSANPVLTESLKYDELGQTAHQVRAIKFPASTTKSYTTQYRYDSFSRMLRLVYPGGERLDYSYSDLGALTSVEARKNNCAIPDLIDTISYDGYGNMVYMLYGNQTENKYEYHPITRTLLGSDVLATAPGGFLYGDVMNRDYSYNSLGMVDQTQMDPHQFMIEAYARLTYDFEYDGLLRLKSTDVRVTSESIPLDDPIYYAPVSSGDAYSVDMTYLPSGKVNTKTSNKIGSYHFVDANLQYTSAATYSNGGHQLDQVTEAVSGGTKTLSFTYNDMGSVTQVSSSGPGSASSLEQFRWNEEQQMVAANNDNGIHHYVYDYKGERIMKSTFVQTTVWSDDVYQQTQGVLDAYTVYVNPYVVSTLYDGDEELTFHYYMNDQRVASGRFARDLSTNEGPGGPGDFEEQQEMGKTGEPSGLPDPVLNDLERHLQAFGLIEGQDYTRESLERPMSMEEMYPEYANGKTDNPGDDSQLPEQTALEQGGGAHELCPIETEVYWYHPNYLGSVDVVTNKGGYVHQYFLYTPWGETMHEKNAYSMNFDSPYRFNAKELDEETGLAYYGARYYQNRLSVWLSVDRLAEKYPHSSPYVFSGNNPVSYVDPNGDSLIVLIAPDGAGGNGHMAMMVQDPGSGEWYYMTQGGNMSSSSQASPQSSGSSDATGGVYITGTGQTNSKAAVEWVRNHDKNNSYYKEYVSFETTKAQDARMLTTAIAHQKEYKDGDKEYNVFYNNCTDFCQDVIEEGTFIDLPIDIDPRPNEYFDQLKTNQSDIQSDLDDAGKPAVIDLSRFIEAPRDQIPEPSEVLNP